MLAPLLVCSVLGVLALSALSFHYSSSGCPAFSFLTPAARLLLDPSGVCFVSAALAADCDVLCGFRCPFPLAFPSFSPCLVSQAPSASSPFSSLASHGSLSVFFFFSFSSGRGEKRGSEGTNPVFGYREPFVSLFV